MNSPHPADPQINSLQALRLDRVLFGTVAKAIQPRDVKQRFGFDPDYGSYTGSPMDQRTTEADDADPVSASDAAMEVAGRADRAFRAGQRAAAADLYRTAAQMLVTAAEVAGAL